MFDIQLFQERLTTKWMGRSLQFYPQLKSTNNKIRALIAEDSNNSGLIVIADNQTAGRGRGVNSWFSVNEKDLTCSVFFLTDLPLEKLGLIALAASNALVSALKDFGISAGVKWPNDIFIDSKKLAGILVESQPQQDRRAVIIGIGVNVNSTWGDWPEELQNHVTSLNEVGGCLFNRELLLSRVLQHLEDYIAEKYVSVTGNWQSSCIHMREVIQFRLDEQTMQGLFTGITENGQAILEIEGKKNLFSTGEIIL